MSTAELQHPQGWHQASHPPEVAAMLAFAAAHMLEAQVFDERAVRNRANEIFLWPVRRPVPEQHPAYQAMDKWIRLLPMN